MGRSDRVHVESTTTDYRVFKSISLALLIFRYSLTQRSPGHDLVRRSFRCGFRTIVQYTHEVTTAVRFIRVRLSPCARLRPDRGARTLTIRTSTDRLLQPPGKQ
jgi:hypothetical protein